MKCRNGKGASHRLRVGMIATIVGLSLPAYANAPTVTILSPVTGNTIFAVPADFPIIVPVSFRVTHVRSRKQPTGHSEGHERCEPGEGIDIANSP